jgi:hypothetical protein
MRINYVSILILILVFIFSCQTASNDTQRKKMIINNQVKTSDYELQKRRNYYNQFYRMRYSEDLKKFTHLQLEQIEELYQVANKRWNTQKAIDALTELINKDEYRGANRIGCALLYLGQLVNIEQRESYLLKAKSEYSNSWYGDGCNVGAYATYQLLLYYSYKNEVENAEKQKRELIEKYANYIDHEQNYFKDLLLDYSVPLF